ncbi:MAG: cytochrome c [Acidobacteriota bacterium]
MRFGPMVVVTVALTAAVTIGSQMIGEAATRAAAVAQGVGPRRSVWDGVYSAAQARRGVEAYQYSCATCHGAELDGDPGRDAPALYGDEFVGEWSGQTVKDLFDLIKKGMPKDSPGSLKAETYADLVAYLLEANEFPAGAQELTADPAILARIAIETTPPVK